VYIMLAVHCFLPDHFYGTETYTLELARGLIRRGHRVTVLTSIFAGEPVQEKEVIHYEFEGIPVISIDKNCRPNTRIKDTYYQIEHRELLLHILQEEKPDILHITHLVNHTAVLIEAAVMEKIPIMATFTDFFGFCLNNRLESAGERLCKGPNHRRTNCVACYLRTYYRNSSNSSWRQKFARMPWVRLIAEAGWTLTRIPGFDKGPLAGMVSDIAYRPNILDRLYQNYQFTITPSSCLREAYLANGCRIPLYNVHFGVDIDRSPKPTVPADLPLRIGFIGQIAPHKAPDLLIDALRSYRPDSVQCKIYGSPCQDPVYMADLRRRAKNLPVEFPGTFPKSKLAEILAGLDLLVIPSIWHENSPLILLYALATHTPVIVTDVRGLTEFITPGQNGFTFPLGNKAALAHLLRKLTDSPEHVRTMSTTTFYSRTVDDMVTDTEALQLQLVRQPC
jgi:glycosyltransferase involved in cell wall biosynthesis